MNLSFNPSIKTPLANLLTFEEKMKNNGRKTCKTVFIFVSLHLENGRCEKRTNEA